MWSDAESKLDYLNFSEIAESVADIINTPELLPISVGIFGDWGAGKSTTLKLIESALERQGDNYIHIHFDAWLYQGYDDARASILEAIADSLIKETENNQGHLDKALSLGKRVNKIRALGVAADVGAAAFGVPTFGAIGKFLNFANDTISDDEIDLEESFTNGAKSLKEVRKSTKGLINEKVVKSPPQEISAFREEYSLLLSEVGRPLVVYIDNLDRCTPINAIHTLEAIRLFLFLPNTAFVIAADEDMIRSAVREYHKGATERHQTDYLDKLIQVPIKVPKPGALETRAYLFMLLAKDLGVEDENLIVMQEALSTSLKNSWKEAPIQVSELISKVSMLDDKLKEKLDSSLNVAERITPLLAGSSRISGNPRIVKRLLNVVKMRKRVSDRRSMNLDESLITKLVIFERCAGNEATIELYRQIDEAKGFPDILKDLEDDDFDDEIPESWKHIESFLDEWVKLPPLLGGVDLRAAAYLSRETLPLGNVSDAISTAAKDLIALLLTVNTRNSPKAKEEISKTPKADYLPVMEKIVNHLRTISTWNSMPLGLNGAILLSSNDNECKKYLFQYLSSLSKQRWMSPILKELSQ
ncbi:KAP family P-loop NTPase fold protein [Marinomonas flavescens]|uniref:KAP family P-loop NTPase fold protein n=1 Tax=Marinomonas flavescens TaxID=2529379 RepID=UPI00105650DD|nr:P-loop NTPase fold protein [Marinomonas flavescens]